MTEESILNDQNVVTSHGVHKVKTDEAVPMKLKESIFTSPIRTTIKIKLGNTYSVHSWQSFECYHQSSSFSASPFKQQILIEPTFNQKRYLCKTAKRMASHAIL